MQNAIVSDKRLLGWVLLSVFHPSFEENGGSNWGESTENAPVCLINADENDIISCLRLEGKKEGCFEVVLVHIDEIVS